MSETVQELAKRDTEPQSEQTLLENSPDRLPRCRVAQTFNL